MGRKGKGRQGAGGPGSSSQAAPVPFEQLAEIVGRLIAKGNIKDALFRAKERYREETTPEAERLLVQAYEARIRDLVGRGAHPEAQSLILMVRDLYPAQREQLAEVERLLGIRRERIEDVVGPLADPDLPQEEREAIEASIRAELADPSLLARAESLQPEHTLRRGAAALAAALEAVTSGPVGEDQVALGEVSRRGPLAPWKYLIRALAALYRSDWDQARKLARGIDPESAPARLLPVLEALMEGEEDEQLAPPAAALLRRVNPETQSLAEILAKIDRAFARKAPGTVLVLAPEAVEACRRERPDLLDPLRQRILARWMGLDRLLLQMEIALGGPVPVDARFFRLLALSAEQDRDGERAAAAWEEFRRLALLEGLIPAGGPEEAAIYLRISEQDRFFRGQQRGRAGKARLARLKAWILGFYENQPAPIKARASRTIDGYFLEPGSVLERACRCYPEAELFQKWSDLVKDSVGKSEKAARAWHEACPGELQPLLSLVAMAEVRRAFPKALAYLDKAEELDRLNHEVRGARFRLTVASVIDRLRNKKTTLASEEILALTRLPQALEGDRPALVIALWCLCSLQDGEFEDARAARGHLVLLFGGGQAEAELLLSWLAFETRVKGLEDLCEAPECEPGAIALAIGRVAVLAKELDLDFLLPRNELQALGEVLQQDDCPLDAQMLRAIAEHAQESRLEEIVYHAAGAGLRLGGREVPRFLCLRGQSLPYATGNRRRAVLTAAVQLARQAGDGALARLALEALDPAGLGLSEAHDETLIEAEDLARVISSEGAIRAFPSFSRPDPQCVPPPWLDPPPMQDEPGVLPALDELEGIPGPVQEEIRRAYERNGGRNPTLEELDRIIDEDPEQFEVLSLCRIEECFSGDILEDAIPPPKRRRRRR